MNVRPDLVWLARESRVLKGAPGLTDAAGFPTMLSGEAPENVTQMKVAQTSPSFASTTWVSLTIQAASTVVRHGFGALWPSAYKMHT